MAKETQPYQMYIFIGISILKSGIPTPHLENSEHTQGTNEAGAAGLG